MPGTTGLIAEAAVVAGTVGAAVVAGTVEAEVVSGAAVTRARVGPGVVVFPWSAPTTSLSVVSVQLEGADPIPIPSPRLLPFSHGGSVPEPPDVDGVYS